VVDSQKQLRHTAGFAVLLSLDQRDGRGQREFLRAGGRNETEQREAADCRFGHQAAESRIPRWLANWERVMFQRARFNPFVYDANKLNGLGAKDVYDMTALRSEGRQRTVVHKNNLPGPIIPVNLNPGASDTNRIVVVWYDDPTVNDELLWPYRAQFTVPFGRWTPRKDSGGS
jgi:hypothetical protein